MTGGGGGAVVDPGNVDGSRIWTTCVKKEEPFMPPEGAPLSPKDCDLLAAWVKGGVLETKSSIAKKSAKPKVDMAVAVTSGKPEGPIAKPEHVLLEPVVVTPRTTALTAMAYSPWTSLFAPSPRQSRSCFTTPTHASSWASSPTPKATPARFSSAAMAPCSSWAVVVVGKLGHAIVWDVKTGKRITEVGKEFDQVQAADISPTTRWSRSAAIEKGEVLRHRHGEELYVISKHTEWILGTKFSPDGVLLATTDRNGNVMVWEAENGGEFYILGQHKAACQRPRLAC
jgi:WD40 repeat protein